MQEKQHKQLGFIDCMGIGIGQIIGSGIMVLTGVVVGVTGHGTPLAFILAALLVICTMASAVVLSSAVPSNGGGYSYVKRLIGPRAGFIYLGMFVLSQVLIATFALGFAQYFAALVPSANQVLVAMVILTLATIVNYIGIKTAASVQNVMVACLLAALALFALFGLPKVDWSTMAFTAGNIMPNGLKNFLQGIALLSFATGGAKFLAETAGEVKNAGKTVPRAMILSTVIVAVFYALIGVVASGVLPLDQVAFQPLTLVAQTIFPAWLYYFFITGGALFALATTLNGTLSWVTRGLQLSAQDGWLPEICARENKGGTPVVLLLVFYVVGVIPILTGMDTTTISNMGVGVNQVLLIMEVIACWRLPQLMPEAYENATMKLKLPVLYALLVLSILLNVGTFVITMDGMTPTVIIAIIVFVALLIAYTLYRWKHVQSLQSKTTV
ncbi:MAG: APC family permease [Oscillospiraceae bacterium]|nr:APC family permease [Oscillospiraceae bacterium]